MKMYDIISHELSGKPRLTGQYTIRLLIPIMQGSVCCNKHNHVTQLVISHIPQTYTVTNVTMTISARLNSLKKKNLKKE